MIPLMHSLILASILFVVGLFGAMIRRNLFFLLLSLLVMVNGAVIAIIAAGEYWQQPNEKIIPIIVMSSVLTQACVGLALLVKMSYRRKTVNIDSLSEMKG